MAETDPPADDAPNDDMEVIEDEVIEEVIADEIIEDEVIEDEAVVADPVTKDVAAPAKVKSTAKADGSPPRGRDVLSIARWGLRGALALLAIACLAVALLGRGADADAAAGDWSVTLSLADGPNYGDVVVFLGTEPEGQELADDAAIQQAVADGLAARPTGDILILCDGGVPLREIDRVQRVAATALPPAGGSHIHVGLNSR